MLKNERIGYRFFDDNRMHALKPDMYKYDTGMSFYEDVIKYDMFGKINANDYIEHYGNASWKDFNDKLNLTINGKHYERIPFSEWLMKYKMY